VDGVKPAKNRRRQRTATPILATTPRPAQPLPAGTTPARRAARAAANPSPRRRASPAQFSRHTASPGHRRLVVKFGLRQLLDRLDELLASD
jgi:hypothetical protein